MTLGQATGFARFHIINILLRNTVLSEPDKDMLYISERRFNSLSMIQPNISDLKISER